MRYFVWITVLLLGLQTAAWGQAVPTWKDLWLKAFARAPDTRTPSPWEDKDMPDVKVKGLISWYTLTQVSAVREKDRFVAQFSKDITALDRKQVTLQGFMIPLEMGEKQKRFLLVSMPPSCGFCLPSGVTGLVEVQAKVPVKYGIDPIVIAGKFTVLKDDPTGLYYRLTDATPVTP